MTPSRQRAHALRAPSALAVAVAAWLSGCVQDVHDADAGVTQVACFGCHQLQYEATTSPTHSTAGYGTGCGQCHVKAHWKPAVAGGHPATFPLVGGHADVACVVCHADNPKPSTQCVTCHLAQWQGAKNPDHAKTGIAKSCEGCHSVNAWKPATGYKHPASFPLEGAHALVSCAACHDGQPKPPKDCAGCHLGDWQGAKNPNHAANNLSKACQSCHTDVAWKPASFGQHDQLFPISYGKHSKISCGTCHANPSNYKAFTCLTGGCHTKGKMDSKHYGEGVGGYVYQSSACYKCHPNGKEDDD